MNSRQISLLAAALIATATPSFAQSRPDSLANPNHPIWGIVGDVVRGVVEAKGRRDQQMPAWLPPMDLPQANRNSGAQSEAAEYPPPRDPNPRAQNAPLPRVRVQPGQYPETPLPGSPAGYRTGSFTGKGQLTR